MNKKRRILCAKPSFEIRMLYENGAEHIEVYSLKEFTSQMPETSMNRRGFLGLSVFGGAAAFAAGLTSKAYGAEEAVRFASLPRERARVSTGEIVRIDKEKNTICVKESEDAEELCINITPETEIEIDGRKKTISQFSYGEIVTIRYTVSFTGERRAISITSPMRVASYYKPEPYMKPLTKPKPTYSPPPSSCPPQRPSYGGYCR